MKVSLLNERRAEFGREWTKPVKRMLPFFQREGDGYVHRVRSALICYDQRTGEMTHTGVTFWCGAHGFLYPPGLRPRKHAPAMVCTAPSPGRIVCATCEGRAVGSGQIPGNKIGEHFVTFRPHVSFYP